MEPKIILAQLRALLERTPDFDKYNARSKEHQVWLSQAYALVSRWNKFEAISLSSKAGFLHGDLLRENYVGEILGIIYRAIADLELDIPSEDQVSFGAGDVYDFFKALNKVVKSAEKSLFIIDPYLDISVFDHYLNSRQNEVVVRLLTNNNAKSLFPAAEKYNAQHGQILEIRQSNLIHDRLVFVDYYVCWLIGQSVKDAAKAKPTYLVEAPPDIVSAKLANYEEIWSNSNLP